MSTLDEYLADQYLSDQQELTRLERTIQDTGVTLALAFVPGLGWPYRLTRETNGEPQSLSHSTTAMVAVSLHKLADDWERPSGYEPTPRFRPPKVAVMSQARSVAEAATALLIDEISARAGTWSGTYGKNDPMTLSFIASLFALREKPGKEENWKNVKDYVERRSAKLCSEEMGDALFNQATLFDLSGLKEPSEVVPNALIPLRIVQAVRSIRDGKEQDLPHFRAYFESGLHDQLSYSSIPDSRFDPAELVFCLEGLLLAQRNAVDRPLLRRTIDVLSAAQQVNAFWRPAKPFMATERGMSLFPVSVEVANSLLRICELFDGIELHDTFGSTSLTLFFRYAQWLRARTVTFDLPNKGKIVGWHSEHVNEPNVVHLWQTSQVLEFFLALHRLLQAHIARTTLVRSRFAKSFPASTTQEWNKLQEESEPVTYLGKNYQIYKRLGEEFVAGWRTPNKPRSYSMLLYGPPGTGKTSIASKLCEALAFRLITITVSDFLAEGGGQIEARAKAIFDVLRAQSDCVVLFDEIDHFLLDRDTKRYATQETVFQFMTPGMLTKLNDLRLAERIIFAISTNYENRIDPAIKRTGRIDQRYLVLPPDQLARKRTVRRVLTRFGAKAPAEPTPEEWSFLLANSVFLPFREIEDAVVRAIDHRTPWRTLANDLLDIPRTTRLATFRNRLRNPRDDEAIEESEHFPLEEFICLLALALEDRQNEKNDDRFVDKPACLAAKKLMVPFEDVQTAKDRIRELTRDLANDPIERVSEYLFGVT